MQWQNNPLAPLWACPGYQCEDTRDRYFQYLLRQSLAAAPAAGSQVEDQPFPFDGGECFVWRAASSLMLGGNGYLQLKDSAGRSFSNEPFSVPGWCGGGDHTPLVVPETVPPGAIWSYNAYNVAESDAGVLYFLFAGVKRMPS